MSNLQLRCLLLENINQSAVQTLKDAGFLVDQQPGAVQGDELATLLQSYDLVGVRSKTKLTRDVLTKCQHLTTIGCFCIGSDQVDLKTAQYQGIPVFNSPYMNTRSVAELAISHIIGLARKVPMHIKNMANGQWLKTHLNCHEIRHKTLGIVGYGHVGIQVAQLAESMGMRVLYHDVEPKLPFANSQSATFEELLAESDFVSLHVPLTEQTENLMGPKEFQMMKPNSYLINLSRGKVVDLEALNVALESHLAGAAIDVYPQEPSSSNSRFEIPAGLEKHQNLYLTPHIGGATEEAQKEIGIDVAQKMIDYVKFGQTKYCLNLPEVVSSQRLLKENQFRLNLIHYNRPGFMARINDVFDSYGVNMEGQRLTTHSPLGSELGFLLLRGSFLTEKGNPKEKENLTDQLIGKLMTQLNKNSDLIKLNRHPICRD